MANKNLRTVSVSFSYLLVTNSLPHKVQKPLQINNDFASKSIRSSNSGSPRCGSRSINSVTHSNARIT